MTAVQFDSALGVNAGSSGVRFVPGDFVRVKSERGGSRWRKPHLRTPGYVFGAIGVIERVAGSFNDPEFMAFRGTARAEPLYRVRFELSALWTGYSGRPQRHGRRRGHNFFSAITV